VPEILIKLARAVENLGRKNIPSRLRLLLPEAPAETLAVRRVHKALEDDRLDIDTFLLHIAANDRGPSDKVARGLGLGIVTLQAPNALKPALHALRVQSAPLAQGIPWGRRNCYVCGTVPAFGELRENDQVKHLRCVSCGADWWFPRLKCMYCGNEDHNTQSSLFAEQSRERMHVEF
jgi:Protein involved in formate dehydrogenase formation